MKSELWIFDRQSGRIGNQLMFLCAAYAYALAEERLLYFPSFARYAQHFPVLARSRYHSPNDPTPDPRAPDVRARSAERLGALARGLARVRLLPGVVRKPSGCTAIALPPSSADFPPPRQRRARRLIMLNWRWFNPVGLWQFRDAILAATAFTPEIESDAATFVAALDPAKRWVGVHVRGTDYRLFMGGRHFHTLDVYRDHMRLVADRLRRDDARPVGFVIFSDEPRTAEEFKGFDVVLSNGQAINDLARMSRLKALIGPMSTFTAWAMFRAGGAAWHIGPRAFEDGLGWVYEGYPVVHSPEALSAALSEAETKGVYTPKLDLARIDLRPSKR